MNPGYHPQPVQPATQKSPNIPSITVITCTLFVEALLPQQVFAKRIYFGSPTEVMSSQCQLPQSTISIIV